MGSIRQRKLWTVVLGVSLLLLFLLLAAQNAFKLTFLNPSTAGEIALFTTLSVVAFLLFLTALLLLVRSALRLYADQRSRVLGARLRTRMLLGAVLLSLLPITCMFGFSYLLMNRAVERWFSQPAAELRDDSSRIALDLTRYASANARAEAASVASELTGRRRNLQQELPMVEADLRNHVTTLQGGFVILYQNEMAAFRFQVPAAPNAVAELHPWDPQTTVVDGATVDRGPLPVVRGALDSSVLQAARSADEPVVALDGKDYVVGSAWVGQSTFVVVALPLPAGLAANLERLHRDGDQYWTLFRMRHQIRATYMLLLGMMTALALFCASWLALHLSKQVTRPVEALADAMNAVAQGNYDRRVDQAATEELGELAAVFNSMAAELEHSRGLVQQSTVKVMEANSVVELRRRELETMLQTIPNGVVMLDADRTVRVANRAFSEMLDPGGQRSFVGEAFDSILPAEATEPVDRLLRRSHRMASASGELEMSSPAGQLHIAVNVALLEASGSIGEPVPAGYVVVLENATELLRAQKQSAWKEVARRVAHEIKNPLTPISLSAEQIRRHIGRLAGVLTQHGIESPSVSTIHKSSEVISASVENMRSLVDQFSSLAEFPNAKPRPADLNTIADNSMALFAGRLQGVGVVRALTPGLPLVMADPEAMKRAISNLVDNAAEAMSGSLLRELRISTALSESADNTVELSVADSGPGVTDEMRERLFLPYFSTKQRGTGLGLTIVSKIIADHAGTIRVEKNSPTGARFIIDLPIAPATEPAEAEPAGALADDHRIAAEVMQ